MVSFALWIAAVIFLAWLAMESIGSLAALALCWLIESLPAKSPRLRTNAHSKAYRLGYWLKLALRN